MFTGLSAIVRGKCSVRENHYSKRQRLQSVVGASAKRSLVAARVVTAPARSLIARDCGQLFSVYL